MTQKNNAGRCRMRWKISLLRLIFLWERRKKVRSASPIRDEQMYFHRWSLDKAASLHREFWGLHWVSGLLAFLQVLRALQYEPQCRIGDSGRKNI